MYSVMDTGRLQRNQAMAAFEQLAEEEAQRNMANDQLDAQQDAAQANNMGTMAGVGFGEDVRRISAAMSEGAGVAEQAVSANVGAGGAPILEAGSVAESIGAAGVDASGVGGSAILESGSVAANMAGSGTAAAGGTAAGTAAGTATGTAAGTATAAAGAAEGAQAGAATFGPWGAVAGLAVGYLASKLF